MESIHKPVFPWRSALWAIAGLLLAALCGLWLFILLTQPPKPQNAAGEWGVTLGAGAASLFLLFRMGRAALVWLGMPRQLRLDAQGMTLGNGAVLPYGDMASLQHDHDRDVLTIGHARGGRTRLWLELWTDAGTIIDTLSQALTVRLLPDVERRVEAGETVPFGLLAVSRDGLVRGGKTIPWGDIQNIRTQTEDLPGERQAHLSFKTRATSFTVDRSKIVNEPVLIGYFGKRLRG